MSMTLITVTNAAGTNEAFQLDPSSTLDVIRTFLISKSIMTSDDSFLLTGGTPIDADSENQTTLSVVLTNNVLLVGQPTGTSPIAANDGVARYNQLSGAQKHAVFANIQLFRGLALRGGTAQKTFNDVYSLRMGYLPAANTPSVNTELVSDYSFSKITSDLKVFSSSSASVDFASSFASAQAEYKTEQTRHTSASHVMEYLMTKYIVRKVDLQVDPLQLLVAPEFVTAVTSALNGNSDTIDSYLNLIGVLNDYGYYVPVTFSLGGAILGSDETQITDFAQADSNKQDFNASFKAKFAGIGGGAAYSNASGSDASSSSSTKFENITMTMIGGAEGLEKDYERWAASLNPAINWAMADVTKFYPTLALLSLDSNGRQQLAMVVPLIDRFAGSKAARHAQPYLDMEAYITTVQGILNPFV